MWGLQKSPVFIKNARNRFRKICRSSSILNVLPLDRAKIWRKGLENVQDGLEIVPGGKIRKFKSMTLYLKAPIFPLWVQNVYRISATGAGDKACVGASRKENAWPVLLSFGVTLRAALFL